MRFTFSLLMLAALAVAVVGERQLDLPSSNLLKSRPARYVKQERGTNPVYKDMLLSRINIHSYYYKNGTTLNHAITCKSHT
jgi:hypothetical protein